jgi:hypothetical protein
MSSETSIKIHGNHDENIITFSLHNNLLKALAINTKLPDWIVNMPGMSGKKYRYLINNLISELPDPRYLEIGSWAGSTACAAAFKNKLNITCIDNWSQFGGPKENFLENIKKISNDDIQFRFIEKDFREVDYRNIGKFNIYLFDGPHSRQDHYDGIASVQMALDETYILIIDDWNWESVRSGTQEAIEKVANIIYSIEIRTSKDNQNPSTSHEKSDWHNGYYICVCQKKHSVIESNTKSPIIDCWTNNQLNQWKQGINKRNYELFCNEISKKDELIHNFIFDGNNVSALTQNPNLRKTVDARIQILLKYFQSIASDVNLNTRVIIPVCIGDTPKDDILPFPIFSFDKIAGSEKILIPDIEYPLSDKYTSFAIRDNKDFMQKESKAVFAGATTGAKGESGCTVTVNKIRNDSVPRIRAAQYFKDCSDVDFKITCICQEDSAETVEYIKSLGIYDGFWSWEKQSNYKFIISMDGNGAAWTRMVKSLYSNSALIKYHSDRVQFYYESLIPWLHYIPVSTDAEVLDIVKSERNEPGKYEYIASAASEFSKQYLCKEVVDSYMIKTIKSFEKLIH